MIKDKQILVAADFAGFPLKETMAVHLEKKGWTITDVSVRRRGKCAGSAPRNYWK